MYSESINKKHIEVMNFKNSINNAIGKNFKDIKSALIFGHLGSVVELQLCSHKCSCFDGTVHGRTHG